jgi:ATP-dependent helicase/nuclease subunit B
LAEREVFELAAVDLGRLYHSILDRFTKCLIGAGQSLVDLDDKSIVGLLSQVSEQAVADLHDELMLADPAIRFKLDRSAGQMTSVLLAQRFLARGARFRARGTELVFDVGSAADLPALAVLTPRGREVLVRGRIDRVDVAEIGGKLAAIVLDYKSKRRSRLALDEVFHGLALQLLTYLLVIKEHGSRLAGGEVEPAGAFYAPLLGGYESVAEPDQVDDTSLVWVRPFRPRGVFDYGYIGSLDNEATVKWSQRVSAYVNKDGKAGQVDKTDVADRGQLLDLMAYVRSEIGRLADCMLDGDIGIKPARLGNWMACRWCPYGSVCRFELAIGGARELPKLRRTEVFERLAGSCKGGSDG